MKPFSYVLQPTHFVIPVAYNNSKIDVRVCIASIIVNDDQQDATVLVYLFIYLFLISSTCFGRCLRPSPGALACIYSF